MVDVIKAAFTHNDWLKAFAMVVAFAATFFKHYFDYLSRKRAQSRVLEAEKAAFKPSLDSMVKPMERDKTSSATAVLVVYTILWLDRAAKHGNSSAKLRLSAILAASPSKSLLDSSRALALTDGLEHEFKHDPNFWEIRAAANASRGDFRAATKAQAQALAEAKRLDWDLTALNQRQSLYASGQAWSGDLLSF